jgi:hypothetical protein
MFTAYDIRFSYETEAKTLLVAETPEAAKAGAEDILTKQGLKDVTILEVTEYQAPQEFSIN